MSSDTQEAAKALQSTPMAAFNVLAFEIGFAKISSACRSISRAPSKEEHAMTIEERASGGVSILDVRGRMTIEVLTDALLTDRVRQLLQRGCNQIVLNLEGVPYVDTSGLCTIVEAYITTKRQGGSLKLLRLAAHVRELLVITRLLTIFEAYESEAAAVASFGPSAPA